MLTTLPSLPPFRVTLSSQGSPIEIVDLLKEFDDIISMELSSELPPIRDIQYGTDLVFWFPTP